MAHLQMTIFDYVVLSILFVSVILSIMRGLVREILSLLAWIIAFVTAGTYAVDFEPMLPSGIGGESLRILIAFILVFLFVLIITALLTTLLSGLLKSIGLGFTDRFLGSLFGFLRGMLVVIFLVLIAGLTTLPQQPFWQQAMLSQPLETIAMKIMPWLPQDLSERISYGSAD